MDTAYFFQVYNYGRLLAEQRMVHFRRYPSNSVLGSEHAFPLPDNIGQNPRHQIPIRSVQTRHNEIIFGRNFQLGVFFAYCYITYPTHGVFQGFVLLHDRRMPGPAPDQTATAGLALLLRRICRPEPRHIYADCHRPTSDIPGDTEEL